MRPEPDRALVHPSLTADMRLALLAEFGARSLYAHLARRTRDAELAQVYARFHEDETLVIETLRRLLAELGAVDIPVKSRRRAALAFGLVLVARGRFASLPLRSAIDSETVVARWYGEYARYLAMSGDLPHARVCEDLARTKLRHAQALEAWARR